MKSFRITSSEYQANLPSVFLFVEGQYYGCLEYPKFNNYPQDVDFWRTATGSDSDRYFNVEEVEVSEEQIAEMVRMHEDMELSKAQLKEYIRYRFNASKEELEADRQYNIEISKYNRPIDKKIEETWWAIRNIIKGL